MAEAVERKMMNVTVRRAKPGDKTAVLDINRNVYDGLDYLPYLYDSLMLDDNYTYYVAEVENIVVAFYGVCLIDGGKTLMARSGRVKADFEGQGILGHILQAVYRDFSSLYQLTPDLKVAAALGDTCAVVNRASFRSISELVWIRNQKIFRNDPHRRTPDRSSPEPGCPLASVTDLSQEDFVHLVDAMDSGQRHFLFPKDVFTTFTWHFRMDQLASSRNVWGNWDPHFTATSSLVERILHPEVGDMEDASEKPRLDSHKTGPYSGLLTASMIVGTPSGPMVFLDFFGSIIEREDLKAHLNCFLSGLPRRLMRLDFEADKLCIGTFTNTEEEEQMVTRELELLGFGDTNYKMKKLCFFWQSFETLKAS